MSKSRYDIQFNMYPQEAYNIIMQWIQGNGFKQLQDENGVYYMYQDVIVGNRGLEFQINGSIATFFAYVGSRKNPSELTGFVGALPKQAYESDLQRLFLCLQGNSNNMQQSSYSQPQYQNQQPLQYQQPYNNYTPQPTNLNQFSNDLDKKQGFFALGSLGIAILCTLLVCCSGGEMFSGAYLTTLGIFFGISGLKCSKKVVAIIGIVLNSLSLLFAILMTILTIIG